MRWALVFLVALLAFVLGTRWSSDPPRTITETVTRYVVPEEFSRAVGELVVERNGLLARLRGVEARAPRVRLVTDTLYLSDTMLVALAANGGVASAVTTVISDSLSTLDQGIDLRDCDDGWAYSGGVWTCDRPRFGHLTVAGGIEGSFNDGSAHERFGAEPFIRMEWTPRFRSTFRFGIERKLNERSWQVRLTKGVRLW